MPAATLLRAPPLAALAAALAAAWRWRRPHRKEWAVAMLASGWALPASVLAGLLAARFGWWKAGPPLLLGSPPELLLLRALTWGLLFALAFPETRLGRLYLAALAADLGAMYCAGALAPAAGGLIFEALAVAFGFLPAQLFARWTRSGQHLEARAWLHFLFHSALLVGVLPALIVALGGGDWHAAWARSPLLNKLYLQLLLVPAVLLVSAAQEFGSRGRGTPMPADPPRRLVSSGVYAYVANPMQMGKFGVLAGWGLFWLNPWMVAAALLGVCYSLALATPREERALAKRFPESWGAYRRQVGRWWPRWRPYCPAQDPARLYLELRCGPCAQLAAWLKQRSPTGMVILPLEEHPGGAPARMSYDPGDGGREEEGVAALARALEHLHLGWAYCGWMLRLPGICGLAQVVADCLPRNFDESCPAGQAG